MLQTRIYNWQIELKHLKYILQNNIQLERFFIIVCYKPFIQSLKNSLTFCEIHLVAKSQTRSSKLWPAVDV